VDQYLDLAWACTGELLFMHEALATNFSLEHDYSANFLCVPRYMFVQLFDRFRPYFSLFISGLPAMFVLPLMIRLYRYPCALVS
jgi:hypothetical protein